MAAAAAGSGAPSGTARVRSPRPGRPWGAARDPSGSGDLPGSRDPLGAGDPPGTASSRATGPPAPPPQPPNRCCPGGRASPAAPLPAPGRPPRAPIRTLKPPATFPGRLPSPRALVPLPGRSASPERCEANPASTRGCAAAGLTPRCRRRCGPPWSGAERIEPGGCRKGNEGEGGSSELPSPTSSAQAGGGSPGLSHRERLRAAGEPKKSRAPPGQRHPSPVPRHPRASAVQNPAAAVGEQRGAPVPAAPRRQPQPRRRLPPSGSRSPQCPAPFRRAGAGRRGQLPSSSLAGFSPSGSAPAPGSGGGTLAGLCRRCGPDGLCPLPGARRGQSPRAPSLSALPQLPSRPPQAPRVPPAPHLCAPTGPRRARPAGELGGLARPGSGLPRQPRLPAELRGSGSST